MKFKSTNRQKELKYKSINRQDEKGKTVTKTDHKTQDKSWNKKAKIDRMKWKGWGCRSWNTKANRQ